MRMPEKLSSGRSVFERHPFMASIFYTSPARDDLLLVIRWLIGGFMGENVAYCSLDESMIIRAIYYRLNCGMIRNCLVTSNVHLSVCHCALYA